MSTTADDATLLLWDLSQAQPPAPSTTTSSTSSAASRSTAAAAAAQQQPKPITTPAMAYTAPSEVNAVAWGGGGGEWISIGCGRLVRTLR